MPAKERFMLICGVIVNIYLVAENYFFVVFHGFIGR